MSTEDTNAARRGSESNDLLGQAPERAEWEHLRRYGYAPGHYMTRCSECMQVVTGVDKRAMTCRPCAEALHSAWSKPPCKQCGAMTADEALSRCMGVRAEGGCHGNDLWPDSRPNVANEAGRTAPAVWPRFDWLVSPLVA